METWQGSTGHGYRTDRTSQDPGHVGEAGPDFKDDQVRVLRMVSQAVVTKRHSDFHGQQIETRFLLLCQSWAGVQFGGVPSSTW